YRAKPHGLRGSDESVVILRGGLASSPRCRCRPRFASRAERRPPPPLAASWVSAAPSESPWHRRTARWQPSCRDRKGRDKSPPCASSPPRQQTSLDAGG